MFSHPQKMYSGLVDEISALATEWGRAHMLQLGHSEQISASWKAVCIFPVGSYALFAPVLEVSLHTKMDTKSDQKADVKMDPENNQQPAQTDLDLLFVGNRAVTRFDFFSSWRDFLREKLAATKRLGKLQSLADAAVPILKLQVDNVSVDMSFATLAAADLGPLFLKPFAEDDALIKLCADHQSSTSLNGLRLCHKLRVLFQPFKEVCQLTLHILKGWARARGIYGNAMGYLGGVNFALMLAACLEDSSLNVTQMLRKVFKTVAEWPWPNPLYVRDTVYALEPGLTVWKPKPNDVMPILTCVYPAINSSRAVTASTLKIILQEFKRAAQIMTECNTNWKAVLQTDRAPEFEKLYGQYLAVSAEAKTTSDLVSLCSCVETRLRGFVIALSNAYKEVLWHLWPISMEAGPCKRTFLIGISFLTTDKKRKRPILQLQEPIQTFKSRVTNECSEFKSDMLIGVDLVKLSTESNSVESEAVAEVQQPNKKQRVSPPVAANVAQSAT